MYIYNPFYLKCSYIQIKDLFDIFRWFQQWRVSFESEKKQRLQVKELTDPENLASEMVPMEFPNTTGSGYYMGEAPFVYIKDLQRFIHFHLDENKE